jgi:putative ABC transport system substrate-binding protein
VRRREFITLLGGAAAAWPLAAKAQQDRRVRRVGVLIGEADSAAAQIRLTALREELAKLGWFEGRNLRIDLRVGAGNPDRTRAYAAELVGFAPEIIVVSSGAATTAMLKQTATIPILFIGIGGLGGDNPVVMNIARPEGNATGFTNLYSSIGGKWLELLKEIAPQIARVAVIFNSELTTSIAGAPATLTSIDQAGSLFAVKAIRVPYRSVAELVRAIDAFAAEPNGGLLAIPSAADVDGDLFLRLAAEHRLPAIYPDRSFPARGGLISYGSDIVDLWRRAPTYVDRILRGAKVRDLPVQFPTKFELVINLKTAKAIGLTISEAFLLRADELIE